MTEYTITFPPLTIEADNEQAALEIALAAITDNGIEVLVTSDSGKLRFKDHLRTAIVRT